MTIDYVLPRHSLPSDPIALDDQTAVHGAVYLRGADMDGQIDSALVHLINADRKLQRGCAKRIRAIPAFTRMLSAHKGRAPDAIGVDYVDQQIIKRLVEYLRPKRLVEVGSGVSSMLLNALAADLGMHVTSLEGDERWFEEVRTTLIEEGFEPDMHPYDIVERPGMPPSLANPELFEADFIYLDAGIPGSPDQGAQIVIDVVEKTGRCPAVLVDGRGLAMIELVSALRPPELHANMFLYETPQGPALIPGTVTFSNFFIPAFEPKG